MKDDWMQKHHEFLLESFYNDDYGQFDEGSQLADAFYEIEHAVCTQVQAMLGNDDVNTCHRLRSKFNDHDLNFSDLIYYAASISGMDELDAINELQESFYEAVASKSENSHAKFIELLEACVFVMWVQQEFEALSDERGY